MDGSGPCRTPINRSKHQPKHPNRGHRPRGTPVVPSWQSAGWSLIIGIEGLLVELARTSRTGNSLPGCVFFRGFTCLIFVALQTWSWSNNNKTWSWFICFGVHIIIKCRQCELILVQKGTSISTKPRLPPACRVKNSWTRNTGKNGRLSWVYIKNQHWVWGWSSWTVVRTTWNVWAESK